MLRVDGHSVFNSQTSYNQAYSRLQRQMDLDLPAFYFSVRPSYFPDTLYKIVPKQRRELLTTLTRQTKNWEAVSDFHSAHVDIIDKSERGEEIQKDVLVLLSKMSSSRDLSDIQRYSSAIYDISIDGENPELNKLLGSVQLLRDSNKFSWPVFSWHGFSNQFHSWVLRIFSQHNVSVVDGKPVMKKIAEAMSWTASMGLIAYVLIGIVSLFIAVCQVLFHESWMDRIVSTFLYVMIAIPTFWFATLMVVFFTTPEYGSWTDIFPSIGIKPSFIEKSFLARFGDNFGQLVLPILCLTIVSSSYLALLTKSDILKELTKPYISTAKAKGVSYAGLIRHHALPNSLVSYITILTGAIPSIFTGSLIIEVIFNIPGVGRLMLYSMQNQDWPVVYTVVVLMSIITIVGYLVGDLVLAKMYPRTIKSLKGS